MVGNWRAPQKNIYLHSLNPVAVVSDLSSQKLATAISHVTVFDAIGQHVKQLLDGWRLVFAHNFFFKLEQTREIDSKSAIGEVRFSVD